MEQAMNMTNPIKKSVYKTTRILIIVVAAFLLHLETEAQIKVDSARVELTKTLKFDTTATGLFNRIKQPIQFRGNRNKRENQRIYDFMLERIKNGELRIDINTVNDIIVQLNRINSSVGINKDSINSIMDSIESIVNKNDLAEKASKQVIDSLKTQMSAVVLENAAINSKEKRETLQEANNNLKEIRNVQYSLDSGKAALDSLVTEDSTRVFFVKNLSPKIQIIAWHNSWLKDDEYSRYNYNYLSAINLYGYELAPNGKTKKQEYIDEFEKQDGVIETAHKKGCKVMLTVYNKLPAEITKFLNNPEAQNALTTSLISLIIKNDLQGVNLYFEDVSVNDSKVFVQFVKDLRQNLKIVDDSIQLTLTVPAKTDDESVKKISAYNVEELLPSVDYFLILTDNLITKNIGLAQASGPLFNSNKYRNYSIESSINFYNQLGIPVSKQIMTVSYCGVEWQVQNFSGVLKSNRKKDLKYADIIQNYSASNDKGLGIEEGFDPDQVAAYLNVTGKNPTDLRQIWFEDSRSLFLKYNWALENNLGGVSIRGLGYDDWFPELWNVLGASLIQIDTTRIDSVTLKKPVQPEKIRFPVIVNAWKGFKWGTFKEDLKWASIVRLKFDDDKNKFGYQRFNRDTFQINSFIPIYKVKPEIWVEVDTCTLIPSRNNEAYLKNKSHGYSLYARWTIYAGFFLSGGILFFALTLLFYFISLNSERYLLGATNVRQILRNIPSLLLFITLLFLGFWLYLDPSFEEFGAGSEQGGSSVLITYAVIIGIAFGWFVSLRFYRYKGSR